MYGGTSSVIALPVTGAGAEELHRSIETGSMIMAVVAMIMIATGVLTLARDHVRRGRLRP